MKYRLLYIIIFHTSTSTFYSYLLINILYSTFTVPSTAIDLSHIISIKYYVLYIYNKIMYVPRPRPRQIDKAKKIMHNSSLTS